MKATSWAVRVVPTFAPIIKPREPRKDMAPAFTNPTTMMVVAVLDWTMAVTAAPARAPVERSLLPFEALF